MIDKNRYMQIKKSIKYMNKMQLLEICDKSGLNELEIQLVLSLQHGTSRISACMDYGMSVQMYTNTLKRAISKLSDII